MALNISLANFNRFLSNFGKAYKCEICEHEIFTMIHNPAEETVGLIARKQGQPLKAIEMVTVCCDNCGNIKMFLGHHVAKWVEENPE